MLRIRILLIGGATLLFAMFASVASAGGWAVVTLDAIPHDVIVAEPVSVGMMIRQHGKTPWVYENVRVRGYHQAGETFVVNAKMDKPAGHYTAELVFNKPGKWGWAVSSGLMPEWQAMPEIKVLDPSQLESMMVNNAPEAVNLSTMPSGGALNAMLPSLALLSLGVLGFVGSAAGLAYWWRNRK